MFMSVKERARQIASGQFSAATTSAPVASLIDLAPEPQPAVVATPKKAGGKETPSKATASASKKKLSKVAPPPEPTPRAAPPQATPSKAPPKVTPGAFPKATSPKAIPPPPEASTPKKSSSKSKLTKEPSSKPSTPKIGSSKPTSSSKVASQPKSSKTASTTKLASPTKSTFSKSSSTTSKSKRSKSPPKRVDSPISDDDDPLSSLKSACLKQVSGITGLGGRRLAIVLKQRSSGEWYAALKDTGSDKYLKMWMNRDKTYATKKEALEAYLVFATKMRNEMRWFPMSPRASSPKGKK